MNPNPMPMKFWSFLSMLVSVPLSLAACKEWCFDACTVLNGPVDQECDGCKQEDGYGCYPGALDYDTWKVRADAKKSAGAVYRGTQQAAVTANGAAAPLPDDVVELTHKSMVYRDKYYNIASRKRTTRFLENPAFEEFLEVWHAVPAESPRSCEVHSCVLIEGDAACAEGRAECVGPRGHLRPFGEQFRRMVPVAEHDATEPLDAASFWRDHIATYEPVVLRGAAAAVTDLDGWSDESLLAPLESGHPKCALADGSPWRVVVESNNRISHNDREPILSGWNFCQYLGEYRKPDAPVYCITSISEAFATARKHAAADKELTLLKSLGLPAVLACDELYTSMHSIRMWMSRGNTTSSQHFDSPSGGFEPPPVALLPPVASGRLPPLLLRGRRFEPVWPSA